MKLLYATNNKLKICNMKRRLENIPVEIITPKDLDIEEDGKTVVANALKKAKAYYDKTKIPTIAGDSSLFIDGISDSEQPGLFVRRIKGKLMTDEEMVNYYTKLIDLHGGRCTGHYVTGLALITSKGIYTKEISEDELIFTSVKSNNKNSSGDPLAIITIDPISLKYYNELTDDDYKKLGLTFDRECVKFLENFLLRK